MATTTSTIETQIPKVTAQSNDSNYIPRGTVTANLSFYKPPTDGSKPFNYVEEPPKGQPQRNFSDTSVPIQIHDLRDHPSGDKAFTLNTNAFATLRAPSSSPSVDFTSTDSIEKNYYPEVERTLLSHVPGATRVLLFDHTIRRADPAASRNPVQRVHIDQTKSSAEARVRHHIPSSTEADTLLHGRVRIINVWRPLNGPVQSFPLAFADSSSVGDEAVVPVEHRYPDRNGETAAIRHTDGQQWWYKSGMTDEERVLLQCYDSEGGARVPHTAFEDPRTPVGGRPRESIEVRALVFG